MYDSFSTYEVQAIVHADILEKNRHIFFINHCSDNLPCLLKRHYHGNAIIVKRCSNLIEYVICYLIRLHGAIEMKIYRTFRTCNRSKCSKMRNKN